MLSGPVGFRKLHHSTESPWLASGCRCCRRWDTCCFYTREANQKHDWKKPGHCQQRAMQIETRSSLELLNAAMHDWGASTHWSASIHWSVSTQCVAGCSLVMIKLVFWTIIFYFPGNTTGYTGEVSGSKRWADGMQMYPCMHSEAQIPAPSFSRVQDTHWVGRWGTITNDFKCVCVGWSSVCSVLQDDV